MYLLYHIVQVLSQADTVLDYHQYLSVIAEVANGNIHTLAMQGTSGGGWMITSNEDEHTTALL